MNPGGNCVALAGPELEGDRGTGGGGAGDCCGWLPRVLEVGGNGLLASCGLSKLGEAPTPSLEFLFELRQELLDNDYRSEKSKVRNECYFKERDIQEDRY